MKALCTVTVPATLFCFCVLLGRSYCILLLCKGITVSTSVWSIRDLIVAVYRYCVTATVSVCTVYWFTVYCVLCIAILCTGILCTAILCTGMLCSVYCVLSLSSILCPLHLTLSVRPAPHTPLPIPACVAEFSLYGRTGTTQMVSQYHKSKASVSLLELRCE